MATSGFSLVKSSDFKLGYSKYPKCRKLSKKKQLALLTFLYAVAG